MNFSVISRKNNSLAVIAGVVLLGLTSVIGLTSCGGGGSSSSLPQDASGLFKSGTVNLDAGAVTASDLRAFVYGNRIMVFSISKHILFDGQITKITGDDFIATVKLYQTGEMTQENIPVTGKVTSQSKITGTLAGTGVGKGTFTLLYDGAYNTPSSVEAIRDQPLLDWQGDLLSFDSSVGDTTVDNIDVFGSGSNAEIGLDVYNSDFTVGCTFLGAITVPNNSVNVYKASVNAPSSLQLNIDKCSSLTQDINFTGFISVLSESGTDQEALFAITDGTNSVFGLLSQP